MTKDSSWRPEGWSKRNYYGSTVNDVDIDEIYEAGADAMLEALRNNQWCPFDTSVLRADFRGKVVIIPDQKPPDSCNSEEG